MKERSQNLRTIAVICLALGIVTLALYLPSVRHSFLEYDDQEYVTENRQVQAGLTWQGLIWAFGNHASNWHPLTWLSHMLDCQLYGLNPAGHHLTNVLLHVANSLLLFLVLQRITGAIWRSASVAALFAWHPLHVESVAWLAERKDVLSALFLLGTIWAYARYVSRVEESPKSGWRSGWYWSAAGLFALGLMSKPMVVTLPFVLLLLDYWPLRRIEFPVTSHHSLRRLLLEKVPFFAMAAIASFLTVAAQKQGYSIVSTAGLPVSQRMAHALLSYAHYLGATLIPRHLAAYYPYETEVPAARILFSGLLLAVITVLAFRFARRCPYLLVGWLWYLGVLAPVIGLVQVGDQAWADRYTYLPLIGIFLAFAWVAVDLAATAITRMGTRSLPIRLAPLVLVVALGVGLFGATSVQLSHWQNTRTLFEHTHRVTRHNYMAITVLGSLLAKDGKLDEAMECYRTALQYKPGYPQAHFFLGNALDQQGKLEEAISHYDLALWFKPIQAQTHVLLGAAFVKRKQYEIAAGHYLAALKLDPDSAVAHNNLARILHSENRLDEAIEHYFSALRNDPNLAEAHNNLGILLLQRGRLAEGADQLREAVRLNPNDAGSQHNLALALNQAQQWSEAAELFAKTVTGASNDPNAHYQFAVGLAHLGKTREAMSHYASALLLKADFPEALNGLAWILATAANPEFRNGTEAVRMAERACELTAGKDPEKLKTLAASYAEAGRFSEAIAAAQKALDLASNAVRKELADECRAMLPTFASQKPWREANLKR